MCTGILPCLPSTVSEFGPVPNKNNKIMSLRAVPVCNKHLINTSGKKNKWIDYSFIRK